jgi:sulfur carrier protein
MNNAAERLVIRLNGVETAIGSATLDELVDEQGLSGLRVATAVNQAFVPERARAATRLAPGDAVEIVTARQGG